MKAITAFNNIILKILDVITIVLVVSMVGALLIQVVARYFFNTGFAWTEESARFMMIFLTYLGASMISLNGKHVNITIVEDALNGWAYTALKVFQELVMLVFLVMIITFSVGALRIAGLSVSPAIGVNMAHIVRIVPIGAALMFLGHLTRVLKFLIAAKKGEFKTV